MLHKILQLAVAALVSVGVIGATPAGASVVAKAADGFTFSLSPDPGDSYIDFAHNTLAFCPACTGAPNVLTMAAGGASFSLVSMDAYNFGPNSLSINVTDAAHNVLANIPLTSTPTAHTLNLGPLTEFLFVPVGTSSSQDCVCIANLAVEIDTDPTVFFVAVPEPFSAAILLSGLFAIGLVRHRRA